MYATLLSNVTSKHSLNSQMAVVLKPVAMTMFRFGDRVTRGQKMSGCYCTVRSRLESHRHV